MSIDHPVMKITILLICIFLVRPAESKVICDEQCKLSSDLQMPVYKWSNIDGAPKAVVVALHGLSMHGGSYNSLAQKLASEGYVVFAPDLRGFGRWLKADKESLVDYYQSQKDLLSLAKLLNEQYPNLPKFYLGESLGADMALRVASLEPKLVDGLILSNPAIKRKVKIWPRIVRQGFVWATKPNQQFNMRPYIIKFASEDPQVVEEILADPLVRKHLRFCELMHSCNTIKATLDFAESIPRQTPVLILEGSADRTIKAKSVVLLLERLHSSDQTVSWLPDVGHVMLETSYLKSRALEMVSGWLNQHTQKYIRVESAEKENKSSIKLN